MQSLSYTIRFNSFVAGIVLLAALIFLANLAAAIPVLVYASSSSCVDEYDKA
jgi:hypothetical protein